MDPNKNQSQQRPGKRRALRFCLFGFLFVALGSGGAGMIWNFSRAPMLSYQGKTLNQWLEMKGGIEPLPDEAQKAVRSMGTNALPRLLKLLSHEDSFARAWLYSNLPRIGDSHAGLTPYYVIQGRGAEGIKALGPIARPALPLLSEMLYKKNGSQSDIADALVSIGPEGIRVVQDGLSNTNASVRIAAILALSGLESMTPDVISAFRKAMTDPDVDVREAATNALSDSAAARAESDSSTLETK